MIEKLIHWWKEALAGFGVVWSFLSDSRTLTALTVIYTGVLLFFKLRSEYRKWKEERNDASRKPVSFRTTPASLDD